MICPCQVMQQQPKSYEDCCGVFHAGKAAATAELLMRSRYSAYAMGLIDYIKHTWHASTCPIDFTMEDDNPWLKLDIISAKKKQVHFRAFFKDENDQYCVLEEISAFVFEQGRWFYLSGETDIKPYSQERNQSCLCGSGKKFKKCCALKGE